MLFFFIEKGKGGKRWAASFYVDPKTKVHSRWDFFDPRNRSLKEEQFPYPLKDYVDDSSIDVFMQAREEFRRKILVNDPSVNWSILYMRNVDLRGIDLSDSTISNFTAPQSLLTKGNFRNTVFDEGSMDRCKLDRACFDGAILGTKSYGGFSIDRTRAKKASFSGTTFNATLHGLDFVSCDFTGALFESSAKYIIRSGLHNCNFDGVDFSKLSLDSCNVEGADFRGALNLHEKAFWRCYGKPLLPDGFRKGRYHLELTD